MDKIQLKIFGLSSSQSQAGSFALILGESNGNRRLPIVIGIFEAQAIAIEIERIIPNRPMTHDLFKSFASAFKYTIAEIVISDLKEGIFYAKIICLDSQQNEVEIDSRPSDAIAIGLRFRVPIYTNERIMSEAGITMSDLENAEDGEEQSYEVAEDHQSKHSHWRKYNQEELQDMLKEALDNEEYEKAAQIRDELNKRN